MLGAAAGVVVVELAYLDNTSVEGQNCSMHLAPGNMGLVAAAVVEVAAGEEGTLDVAGTDEGAAREGEVVVWGEEEGTKTK